MAPKIIKGLAGHTGLKRLEFNANHSLGEGYKELAALLRNRKCSIEELVLDSSFGYVNNIDGIAEHLQYRGCTSQEGLIEISCALALAGRNSLKVLSISDTRAIHIGGWRALSNLHRSPQE